MTAVPLRSGSAGVTLVEMLVVLALFAVVSGAVVMSLPLRQTNVSAETSATALAQDIRRAMDLALAQGVGFGIFAEDDGLRFMQRSRDGDWHAHTDTHLSEVKLFPVRIRISGQDADTTTGFGVSHALVPDQSQPLQVVFGERNSASRLTYDGATVRVEQGEGIGNEP